MAKTKEEKMAMAAQEKTKVAEEVTEQNNGPSYEDLLKMVQTLATEVSALKNEKATDNTSNGDYVSELLKSITNRKSDREVVIIHNQELNGDLTTHLELSNISVDFRQMGEERLLSWQQFEECVSKYRSFFEKKIILLGPGEEELSERYNLPFLFTKKYHILTKQEIQSLPTLNPRDLEDLINSLSDEDQVTIFNLWLGKCYTKEPGYYDRSKVEMLNRLSQGAFANLIAVMNGDNREIQQQ